ncbi:hypothetical protein OSG_eHP27_00195 [environmental Halophage eHP-27]|nr:hypothetical protein OSG_eHP27_00195 [environmental Halophage eHP-27]
MSIFEDAARSVAPDDTDDADTDPDPDPRGTSKGGTGTLGGSFTTQIRGQTVSVDGDDLTIERPETKQPDDKSGNWLTASDAYGVPRGIEAAKQRQIVQTAAMQSITNGIVDQLLGGELAFLDDEDAMDELSDSETEAAGRLKTILRDVLTGPHMGDEDLDDIVTACVEDMLGPGNAYIQLLAPEGGELPVVSLSTLDPLTVRHNVDEHGYPEDPPYWQALGAFSSTSFSASGVMEPVPLQDGDVAVLRYPKGNRSYRRYPVSAAWQVKEWLEILADSVTHHKRYYSDNEVPPGLMQIVNASESTINDIVNKVEQASGDPRDFPVVGGEAPANWIEMGGTAINLDVIQEQQWFFQMCLGSLGLGKAEVGMIEDVNRANGEIEADRVYKRVAGPFGKQFEQAFLYVARQFPAFTELGEPFTPTLAYTDPRAEAAREDRLRKDYEAGKITLRQYVRRSGNADIADDPDSFVVDLDGETIDYGSHPKWVASRLLSAAGATKPDAEPTVGAEPGGEE